ncbi:MAG TPA: outer membrane beta-barrel protein [Candidatus Saccharimonadales bacterium]|nr:outer membrane beta-barrel protein [Candidatus Saccharimonadales bacterium]
MRRFTVLFALVLAFGAFAMAQMEPKPMEIPRTEFFLGYAYQHADVSGSNIVDSASMNGFDFQFSHYFKSNFGFTMDLSHTSNSKVDSTGIKYSRSSYMLGPSFRLHAIKMFTPSVHALAGVDHDDLTEPFSNTNIDYRNTDFAAAAGVAFDANLSRHLAVRVAQVDYVYTHHFSTNQSSFRYAGGVVARF